MKGRKLCSTCATRLRQSPLPYEQFVQVPRTAPHLHLPVGGCRVSGCERPWTDSGTRPVCRTHWWQMQKHGGTLEEFLADPAVKGLPGLGDCAVLACNRRAVSAGDTRLCHAHEKRLWALRKNPAFDQAAWLRTAPSCGFAAEVSFRGLPDLVVAQLLFGLQHRCHKGARTEIGNFRALIDRTIRPSGARRLEDVPDPAANSEAQIAITADDVRSGQLTTHDVNFARYREECLSEGIDPHTAVEVEALRPGLLRQRLDETIEGLVDDVRQWNIEARTEEAERELLGELQDAVKNIAWGES
ncbi:hypothetical protein [Streptomyces sp. NPDC052042]|uniref:hypothetical protein n=1 Tax=Streptomyces sp. NPDC052042 TaxID=3365683 RepID=UPI0037D550F7